MATALTYQEIADYYKCSVCTVKTRLDAVGVEPIGTVHVEGTSGRPKYVFDQADVERAMSPSIAKRWLDTDATEVAIYKRGDDPNREAPLETVTPNTHDGKLDTVRTSYEHGPKQAHVSEEAE